MIIKYREGKIGNDLKLVCPHTKDEPPIKIGSSVCQLCKHCSEYDQKAGTLNCALHLSQATPSPVKNRYIWLKDQITERKTDIESLETKLAALKAETLQLEQWYSELKVLICDDCDGSGQVDEHLREDWVEKVTCGQCSGTGVNEVDIT